ncbi:LapA family protein [Marinobacterium sp. D7]|uniref:LapA family protein n=1 Tax=Marinobacterium ramblicola TaxID=2849041 RepID=UPI001C2D77FA|nr:LapA family protein [Marinobacterium ramblicola]MBV1787035.1 LapA family protein [Marinobacterium ramblicola]
MNWLKTLLATLIGLVIIAVGILFTVHNTAPVSIDLVFVQLPEATLSLWLILAFVTGGICGVLLSTLTILALKTRLHSAQRKVKSSREEIERLRASALKEPA